MKTIKIQPDVHKRLKTYVAQKDENISTVAGIAIMRYLNERGFPLSETTKTNKPIKK